MPESPLAIAWGTSPYLQTPEESILDRIETLLNRLLI